jgi:hypothetical protein
MLKFEDPNKGPQRLLSEDEQDLGEVLRIELNRLVSSLHPADTTPKNAPGLRLKRLGRVQRSISEFVTSTPRRQPRQRAGGARRDLGASLRCRDFALRRELDTVGKPSLVRNMVTLGRRGFSG